MYKKPLAHNHGYLPMDIISEEDMRLLTDHFSIAKKCTPDNFEKKMNQLDSSIRSRAAELYEKLRGKGFMPDEIGSDGKIIWLVQEKDDVQGIYENYMPELPNDPNKTQITAMQKECRTRFSDLFKNQ